MHDCISQVRADLMAQDPSIKYIRFELSNIQNLSSDSGLKKTGQAIEIGYEKTNKKGEVKKVYKNSFVTHEYCPFCGEKYPD